MVAGIILTYVVSRLQARSQEESPEAIKERVSQLEPELRKQVQIRSYGARSKLIEAPLRELNLDITPRVGWVRDPRLEEPEPVSGMLADDIVGAFEASKRRMLIVGEPGSGKTMAAYSIIEYLDETEGDERVTLLVNLSAWEAQDSFEAFLVDYLCSSVGYEVRERAVARAFIDSDLYNLILDGLDEIPAGLRKHFSERLDEFVRGLAGEVGVVVTSRTQEYEEMLAAHSTGLGLVQAVEILPLTSEQLDSALAELAKLDEDWEAFLSRRHLTAYKRVRNLLSNPLFLNLTVVGHLSPSQLLDWTTTEEELRYLVLDSYLNRTLADQRQYEPAEARRILTWVARFLHGAEVSPFGLKTSDYTVFDLANLTPPEPPKWYRLFAGLIAGLFSGLVVGLSRLVADLFSVLLLGLLVGLFYGLVWELGAVQVSRWTSKRSALSSRLTFVWSMTGQRRHDFLRKAGRELFRALVWGLVVGLFGYWIGGKSGLGFGLLFGLTLWLLLGLVETRPMLTTSRTPREARSRSLITALLYVLIPALLLGLGGALLFHLTIGMYLYLPLLISWVITGLFLGLLLGLYLGLSNGGWFVVLQKIAHRRLARAGNLPSPPYDFLEWGIEKQIFRRVGGGVRFRHNLIQQHLAKGSGGKS